MNQIAIDFRHTFGQAKVSDMDFLKQTNRDSEIAASPREVKESIVEQQNEETMDLDSPNDEVQVVSIDLSKSDPNRNRMATPESYEMEFEDQAQGDNEDPSEAAAQINIESNRTLDSSRHAEPNQTRTMNQAYPESNNKFYSSAAPGRTTHLTNMMESHQGDNKIEENTPRATVKHSTLNLKNANTKI